MEGLRVELLRQNLFAESYSNKAELFFTAKDLNQRVSNFLSEE